MRQAGELNYYIEIRQPGTTRDAAGDTQKAYTLLSGAWARLVINRGRESVEADKPSGVIEIELEIRAIEGVTRQCQVLFHGDDYQIDAILPAKGGALRPHCRRID